jgi:hypothetical protein
LNKTENQMVVECDLDTELPLLPAELKLVQELLPELLKDMRWLLEDKE